jgi:hypothetical protein
MGLLTSAYKKKKAIPKSPIAMELFLKSPIAMGLSVGLFGKSPMLWGFLVKAP